jgi:hypothetical protein
VRVGLIGCGKEKLSHPAPASDLYTGQFFKLCKQWISKPGRVGEWGILSAKHGLVLPDQELEPYELSLNSVTPDELLGWYNMVRDQLLKQWGREVIYMVLAGSRYRQAAATMPMVEDVIWHWTEMRRAHGMRRPQMGIGVIKRYLKNDEGYY